jgi:hypothetical protein
MIYALEERIGDPLLFCGRKQQMGLLMNWVEMIPRKLAKSRALLGRRKCGKTALMQRLFNILWNQNGPVIPFYLEVQESNQSLLMFSEVYYRTFMSQYLSFKTRRVLPLNNRHWKWEELIEMAREIKQDSILRHIDFFREDLEKEKAEIAFNFALTVPGECAGLENGFALIMIDEIQFMTKYIFYDKAYQIQAYNLPGMYHGPVESKIAPMLVAGSYVGWMVQMMREMFVGGRLKQTPISPRLAPDEGLEAVYRYAAFYNQPLSDEVAVVINQLTQSDPFYIATLFRSDWEEQDFSSVEGAINTLSYEIRNRKGELFGTWSEYIFSTLKTVNDRHAKKILLYLSKERYKECTREEISTHIDNQLSEAELEEKLRVLEYGDLITMGSSNFRYCGIPDDTLDLIFRDLYQEEIDRVQPNISEELTAKVAAWEGEKKALMGRLNELKGRMLELIMSRELNKYRNKGQPIAHFRERFRPLLNENEKSLLKREELLTACSSSRFDEVRSNYYLQLPQTTPLEVDVLAQGSDASHCWALVFEIKNRNEKHKPSMAEAQEFVTKCERLKQELTRQGKTIRFICPVYLSAPGFTPKVETWLHEQGGLTTDLAYWELSSHEQTGE